MGSQTLTAMLLTEQHIPVSQNYLQVTADKFSAKNRCTVVEWITDVCNEFKKEPEVLKLFAGY